MNTTYRRPMTDAERAEALRYLANNPDAVKNWAPHLASYGVTPPPKPRSWWGRFVEAL